MGRQPDLPVAEAARSLGTSPETLRRWCREGCPAQVGRGRYRVDLARAWRDAKAGNNPEAHLRSLAGFALDFWRRGCEPAAEGQRVLGIGDAKAAALLHFFIGYAAKRLLKAELRTAETELLAAIAVQGNVHAVDDSLSSGKG